MVCILSYLLHFHRPYFIPAEAHAVCPVDRDGLCHPRDLCCLTDCSAEAVVCVERVQMAIMRNSVHTTTSTHTSLNTHELKHTQSGKPGRLSAWNDYFSSNGRAAGRVFIDYSLNRDAQANTPARMCARPERVCSLFPPAFIQTFL